MNRRRFFAALISAVGLAVVAACSGAGSTGGPAGGSANTAVLTVASSASVTTWDPIKSFSTEAMYLGNLYEPLLWKNPSGSPEEYTPGLAASWQASADGLTWTFKIRQGVTFHTGEKVTLWSGVPTKDYPTLTVTEEDADGNQASSGRVVLSGAVPPG